MLFKLLIECIQTEILINEIEVVLQYIPHNNFEKEIIETIDIKDSDTKDNTNESHTEDVINTT